VVFHALSRADVRQIVDLQLARLEARLADRHLALDFTDRAKEHLAERGYDPVYGARPLRRAIQQEVETRLAQQIVAGEVRDGARARARLTRPDLPARRPAPKQMPCFCGPLRHSRSLTPGLHWPLLRVAGRADRQPGHPAASRVLPVGRS